jgi:hypothetical protein
MIYIYHQKQHVSDYAEEEEKEKENKTENQITVS